MAGKPRFDRTPLRLACDGQKTLVEVAEEIGWPLKRVKRIAAEEDLPRRKPGQRKAPRTGENNPAFQGGRRIDLDGYAYVTPPLGHPTAYVRQGRSHGTIREHRLVMEQMIGRPLEPQEVVDHIDGLTLHNAPENLRLFATNADHLAATVHGKPQWSDSGLHRIRSTHRQRSESQPVDIYRLRKGRGDVRLRQILLLALKLGIDNPHLCGTLHWLERAGIDPTSDRSLELGLTRLENRYALDLR